MAELLIRVIDKINKDPYLNAQCTKRGDVIVVQEDGWGWGKEELSTPFWRIIKLPGVAVTNVSHFLSSEKDMLSSQASRTLQCRGFKIDLDNPNLSEEFKLCLADEKRLVPVVDVKMDEFSFNSFKIAKAKIPDPAIFGDITKVIG